MADKWHDNIKAELTRLRLCFEKEVEEEKASQSIIGQLKEKTSQNCGADMKGEEE